MATLGLSNPPDFLRTTKQAIRGNDLCRTIRMAHDTVFAFLACAGVDSGTRESS
jgi:hypothetical protein